MRKRLTTVALCLATASVLSAKPIQGVVRDSRTGEPLIGTVVQVKGQQSLSTTTGLDGSFKLLGLPDEGKVTLVITYMSYKTKELTVDMSHSESLSIKMDEDTKELGEVVLSHVELADGGATPTESSMSFQNKLFKTTIDGGVPAFHFCNTTGRFTMIDCYLHDNYNDQTYFTGGNGVIAGCTFSDSGNAADVKKILAILTLLSNHF